MGVEQSRVSRVEIGRTFPERAFLKQAVGALNVTAEEASDLWAFYEIFLTEVVTPPAGRLAEQQGHIRDLESTAKSLRCFESCGIPGLLQHKDYIRAIFTNSAGTENVEAEKAILARIERQEILKDTEKSFVFLLMEQSLTNRICSANIMRIQCQWLRDVIAGIGSRASFRIVRRNTLLPELPMGTFVLLDRKAVLFDTFAGFITMRDETEIRDHERIFDAFSSVALDQKTSLAYLDVIVAQHVSSEIENSNQF